MWPFYWIREIYNQDEAGGDGYRESWMWGDLKSKANVSSESEYQMITQMFIKSMGNSCCWSLRRKQSKKTHNIEDRETSKVKKDEEES